MTWGACYGQQNMPQSVKVRTKSGRKVILSFGSQLLFYFELTSMFSRKSHAKEKGKGEDKKGESNLWQHQRGFCPSTWLRYNEDVYHE